MPKKINVAVIGTGSMGKNHARVYSEMKNCKLIAICDIDSETMKKISQEFHCRGYLDYKEMLQKEKIDAISIAVPTKSHKDITIYCLKNKISTLVEKPIAFSLKEADQIIESAENNNVLLTVGHIERFNPAVQKLKKIIEKGILGEIVSIEAKRVGPFIPKNRDTGVLLDLAVHDIDIMNYLYQTNPNSIFSNGGKVISEKYEDYAEIFLKYGKRSGYIHVNWINPVKIRELTVTGTKGYAHLNYIKQEMYIYKNFISGKLTSDFKKIPIKFQESLKLELESFIKNVINKTEPLVSGINGKKALEVANKALNNI